MNKKEFFEKLEELGFKKDSFFDTLLYLLEDTDLLLSLEEIHSFREEENLLPNYSLIINKIEKKIPLSQPEDDFKEALSDSFLYRLALGVNSKLKEEAKDEEEKILPNLGNVIDA